jgi:hypothetical protein
MQNQHIIYRSPGIKNASNYSENINFEYMSKYNAFIPKAPAFRIVSGRKVQQIVNRLNTPKTPPSRQRGVEKTSSVPLVMNSRFSILRLNQPTVASYIRFRLHGGKDRMQHFPEIRDACDRYIRHPPQGHIPSMYKNWLAVEGIKI